MNLLLNCFRLFLTLKGPNEIITDLLNIFIASKFFTSKDNSNFSYVPHVTVTCKIKIVYFKTYPNLVYII